jgi:magnesium-transporting ATPase (P-type)
LFAVKVGDGGTPVSITVLVALLVCLIPTTIAGLLSAIGVAGMSRMMQANVIATSGRAVEAAGDVDVLLMDKTGTITLGNRQASAFLPADGVTEAELQRVKTQWVASEIYKLDSVFNQARELGVAWTLGLPPDHGAQLISRLRQVTPAQVQAVAQKYFGDDSLTVAILRPQPLSGQPRARRALPGARH